MSVCVWAYAGLWDAWLSATLFLPWLPNIWSIAVTKSVRNRWICTKVSGVIFETNQKSVLCNSAVPAWNLHQCFQLVGNVLVGCWGPWQGADSMQMKIINTFYDILRSNTPPLPTTASEITTELIQHHFDTVVGTMNDMKTDWDHF